MNSAAAVREDGGSFFAAPLGRDAWRGLFGEAPAHDVENVVGAAHGVVVDGGDAVAEEVLALLDAPVGAYGIGLGIAAAA